MNIYHITRRDRAGWDETRSLVVAAESAAAARLFASRDCGDEGPDIWLLTAKCVCIGVATDPELEGVICRDFNAG